LSNPVSLALGYGPECAHLAQVGATEYAGTLSRDQLRTKRTFAPPTRRKPLTSHRCNRDDLRQYERRFNTAVRWQAALYPAMTDNEARDILYREQVAEQQAQRYALCGIG